MANKAGYTSELLREKLGETLDALLDKDNPMDLDRAKTVAGVAQVMINIAKVEVDHMKVAGGVGTGFIVEKRPENGIANNDVVGQLTAGSNGQRQPASDEYAAPENNRPAGTTYKADGLTIHRGSRY